MQREATYGERDTGRDEKLRGSRGGEKKRWEATETEGALAHSRERRVAVHGWP